MRTEPRFTKSHRAPAHWLAPTVSLLLLVAVGALDARADTSRDATGRRIATGPKGPQQGLDEFVIDPPPAGVRIVNQRIGFEESGTEERREHARLRGRYLRSTPSLPVSVGLVGCPGCSQVLGLLGGVVVDRGDRQYKKIQANRFQERRQRRSPEE